MLQDICPHIFDNQFISRKPQERDYIFSFDRKKKVLLSGTGENAKLPIYSEILKNQTVSEEELIYLFSIDDKVFYLCEKELKADGYGYKNNRVFMNMEDSWLAFAGATALHLAQWYDASRFCGKCSAPMKRGENERVAYCPECGYSEYPRISPVVIVGITDGDKLLLTRYSNAAYKRHALIAGFMEIGETPEDTIKREVLEEVGVKVKNIRYYKSQPWAYSESMLMGFFADLDGSPSVSLDDEELSEAEWFERDEIPSEDNTMSLTWDMIEYFRSGKVQTKYNE